MRVLNWLVSHPMDAARIFSLAGLAVLVLCAIAYVVETVTERREARHYDEWRNQ